MRKTVNTKFFMIITILMISVLIIIFNSNVCFALGDVTNSLQWEAWEPESNTNSLFTIKMGQILGVIRTIGIIVSVGSLSVIGIKFMLGSAEEKANYKQALMPWTIGAVMVFAITFVPTLVYDFTSSMAHTTGVSQTNATTALDYVKGYDQGIIDARAEIANHGYDAGDGETLYTYQSYKDALTERINVYNSKTDQYHQGYCRGLDSCRDYARDEGLDDLFEFIAGHNKAKTGIANGEITYENHEDIEKSEFKREQNGEISFEYWVGETTRIAKQVDVWEEEAENEEEK